MPGPDGEPTPADLTVSQREAIVRAVEAVVRRDVAAVEELMSEPGRDHAAEFWTWADDYGDDGRLDLVMPPGEIEDWRLYLIDLDDGRIAVEVPMWATIGDTDLTLELELREQPDGTARAELRNMHVM